MQSHIETSWHFRYFQWLFFWNEIYWKSKGKPIT